MSRQPTSEPGHERHNSDTDVRMQADAVNVPTWTGRSGTSGAPASTTPPRRFGTVASNNRGTDPSPQPSTSSAVPSAGAGLGTGKALRSDDLLAKMRQRQQAVASDGITAADPEVAGCLPNVCVVCERARAHGTNVCVVCLERVYGTTAC